DVAVAGNDGNVQLAYLGSAAADALRREILQLASGLRASRDAAVPPAAAPDGETGAEAATSASADVDTATGAPASVATGIINQRVNEFLAPELDADVAPPESVVRIPVVRLIGSVLLSGYTVFLLVAGVALIVGVANDAVWPVFAVLPILIGSVSYYWNRVTRMLRYSIAGTPDGVRVGYGLLSTNNETLPPGRIHAIGVSQPLLWRPFGWWRIQVNTASRARSDGQNRDHTTVMPVGKAEDVSRVLGLMLPAFVGDDAALVIRAGLVSRGDDDYSGAPRRAAWLRPFSWRRTGFRAASGVLLLRHGLVSRHLAIVPYARVQSVSLSQGPLQRSLRLAAVQVQTVSGPVIASLDVADAATAVRLFAEAGADAVTYAASDTSHHWSTS
ncbi:MAG: PH domain-containing protein, partial [Leifsonia flava]